MTRTSDRFQWLLVAIVLVFALVGLSLWWKHGSVEGPPPYKSTIIRDKAERATLKTAPISRDVQRIFTTERFELVTKFQNVADDCRDPFLSSVRSGSAQASQLDMADPHEPFQSSDVLEDKLPFRRLVFAGQAQRTCFIYYQHGGTMNPRFCLAVIDRLRTRLLWVGADYREARTLNELREQVLGNSFKGSASVC